MKYITEDGELLDTMCEDCAVPFFKTPNNHDTLKAAMRGAYYEEMESKTDQSFAEEANINTIMGRLQAGQVIPAILPEHFGVDDRIDLFEARMRIAESNQIFWKLDATRRAEYQNDPARWEQAVAQAVEAGDRAKLRALGLDAPEPPEEPVVATPAPTAPGAEGGVSAPPKTPEKTETPNK